MDENIFHLKLKHMLAKSTDHRTKIHYIHREMYFCNPPLGGILRCFDSNIQLNVI